MKLCKRCLVEKPTAEFSKHDSTRDKLDTKCKICRNTVAKQYYAENKERILKERKADARRLERYYAVYRSRNKEKIAEKSRAYQKANKDRVNEQQRKRYHRTRTLPTSQKINSEELYLKAYRMKCQVDHIIPIQGINVSGLDVHWNLQILTPADNLKKSSNFDNDSYQEWRKSGEVGPYLPK